MADNLLPILNWREKAVLRIFKRQSVLRYHDLPGGVGTKTMRGLMEKGLVGLVDKNIGEFAKIAVGTGPTTGFEGRNLYQVQTRSYGP
jgi:hypothetical protein